MFLNTHLPRRPWLNDFSADALGNSGRSGRQNAGTNLSKSEFVYDGMSIKVISRKYTWSGGAWALVANSEVRRIYDGMGVVQERDSSNNVITKYTRAGNIGGLLSKSVTSNGWSTRYDYFYHYDGSGNVTQMTDVSQATVAEYAYDAYDNTTRLVGTQAAANLYRYSTKEFHPQRMCRKSERGY